MNCNFHPEVAAVGVCSAPNCTRALCPNCMNAFTPPRCPSCAASYCQKKIYNAKIALILLGLGFIGGLIYGFIRKDFFHNPLIAAFMIPMAICGIWMFIRYLKNQHFSTIVLIFYCVPVLFVFILIFAFLVSFSFVIVPIMAIYNIWTIRKYKQWLNYINHEPNLHPQVA